ncbi:MAG: hypothetical protein MAG715_00431 [Methanonatronarchaeales archaeon]|nr:hypothetical protein [Methanonatronarchaeales archaeon]
MAEARWEYRTVPIDPRGVLEDRSPDEKLNELGAEGWEVAASAPMETGPGSGLTLLILKRPLGGSSDDAE